MKTALMADLHYVCVRACGAVAGGGKSQNRCSGPRRASLRAWFMLIAATSSIIVGGSSLSAWDSALLILPLHIHFDTHTHAYLADRSHTAHEVQQALGSLTSTRSAGLHRHKECPHNDRLLRAGGGGGVFWIIYSSWIPDDSSPSVYSSHSADPFVKPTSRASATCFWLVFPIYPPARFNCVVWRDVAFIYFVGRYILAYLCCILSAYFPAIAFFFVLLSVEQSIDRAIARKQSSRIFWLSSKTPSKLL